MGDRIRVQMLGGFLIYINEQRVENPALKSRKGAALMILLALNEGRRVPNQRLLRSLWSENKVTNPENALKTLVSRMRTTLNQMSPGLGGCIVSDRGAYHWQNLPDMKVDVLELSAVFAALGAERDKAALRRLYQRMLQLYAGDLYQTGEMAGEQDNAQQLRSQYLTAVYRYIELLKATEEHEEICAVCRTALEVDNFDDRLHIELMKAMVSLNRASDAMAEFKHAADLTYRYLGAEPSAELQAFCRQLNRSRNTLKFNLDAIRGQLQESGPERGAVVCGYDAFRVIYNLLMRNLESLGVSMFLGVIMVGDTSDASLDSIRQNNVMGGLVDICRENLRRGDVVTHYAPTVVALLLPMVNYETGRMVMERLRRLFYQRFPNSDIAFHYRLGILGEQAEREAVNLEALEIED